MTKKSIFKGAGVAIVTPFDGNNRVNYPKLAELIEFQIENSTDAIISCGTTGESSTLTDQEHIDVIKFTVDTVAGRVPVIAGTGSNDTAYAIELSKQAEAVGADGLLIVTPYYNKTSQAGLIRHYFSIADSVNIPIIVYNVPSRTGLDIKPETYKAMSEHRMIVAIKEANGNISSIVKTFALCGDKLDIYSGNDDQIVPILSLGGAGVISVLSNIAPKQTHDICQLYFSGRQQESCRLQLELLELIEAIFCDVNPIPVKAAMNYLGMDVGECRMPLTSLSDDNMKKLKNAIDKAGIVIKS